MNNFHLHDFHSILLSKLPNHGAGLDVVSGYVSSEAIYWALSRGDASQLNRRTPRGVPSLRVLVGMASDGSISRDEHEKFKELCETFGRAVRIRYANPGTHQLVHSKVYVVRERGIPSGGYLGSANFTGNGLGLYGDRQKNATVEVDASWASDYFEEVFNSGIDCTSDVVESVFHFPGREELRMRNFKGKGVPRLAIVETVKFPMFNVKERRPYAPGAGVNWGISSPTRTRSAPDEEYLSISKAISNSGFFPRETCHLSFYAVMDMRCS